MLALYIIGVVMFGMFAAYRFGQAPSGVQDEIVFILIFGVLFWPAVLAFLIIIAPFAGMAYLGHRAKEKRIEAEKQKEVKV